MTAPRCHVPEVTSSTRDLWHSWSAASARTVWGVQARTEERLSAATGLTATLAVGVTVLFASLAGPSELRPSSDALWWSAYALYVAAFAIDADVVRWRPVLLTNRRLFAIQLVAGAVVWLTSPAIGWTAVLLVVTAATSAYVLSPRGVVAVVLGQSAIIALGSVLAGYGVFQVVLSTAVYGSFQVFAVMVVGSEQREVAARAELAAAHAELRAASTLLAASTRTAERLRISRDLHDVVGHQLTALALELEVASHQADGPAAEHVTRARAIAKDLLTDVREAVEDIRHVPQGLDRALRELVTDLPGLAVQLTVEERVPLEETSALTIVRCVQEVVTNTLRHADADHLTISVVVDEAGVRLDARDDGRGAADLTVGSGLTGLRERIEQLGGEVALQTAPGRGFTVAARVPAA